jgi:DNA-binding MarR family transcriptional regulator
MTERQPGVKFPSDGVDTALASFIADVLELAGRFRQSADDIARREGQTSARWYALSVFSGDPLTVSHAARRLGTTRQALQRTSDDLVGAGLLVAEPNPDHKTSPYLRPTAEGAAVLERITAHAVQARRSWLPDPVAVDIEAGHTVVRHLLTVLPE